MIVTLTPNPSLDLTLEVGALQRGAVHRASSASAEAAGKGVNISKALHQNGLDTVAIVPNGGSNGSEICRLLRTEGVSYVSVPIEGDVRANVSIVEPGGVVTKVNEAGPDITSDEVVAIIEACDAAASPGGWLVATGSLAPGMPVDFYGMVCRRLKELDVRVAIDSSGPPLEASLAAGPDLVKPNRHELEELLGEKLATLGHVVAAADRVLEMGAGQVLVSLGSDGAVLVDADGAVHGTVAVAEVRNTVGAGDALLAGYLAGGGAGSRGLRRGLAWARASVESAQTAMDLAQANSFDGINIDAVDPDLVPEDKEPTAPGAPATDQVRSDAAASTPAGQ